jgi:HTH-type transcriptional regulator/antitoxin HigA
MAHSKSLQPEWISAPGSTIADLLDERGWSPSEFAHRAGFSPEMVHALLQGDAPITDAVARQLAETLGSDAAFWINREHQYRAALQRADRS